MNLLSLNCRGLGNPDAVGGLRNLIRREAPIVLFLCETKLSGSEWCNISRSLDGYDGLSVDSVGRSGGLALLWQKGVRCRLRSMSVHYMDVDLEIGEAKWRFTGFYGWPAVQDRHLSWQQLRLLAAAGSDPWLCMGDFNEILYATEMRGGERPQWQMNNFRNAVDDCGLRDIVFEGHPFTFDNGQVGDDNRQSRIDQAMVTENWQELYPFARLIHLTREWSDHSTLKLVLDGREGQRCEEVVRRVWERGGTDLPVLLSDCAAELLEWKSINIGKIVKTLSKRRRRLQVLDGLGRTTSVVQERKRITKEIAQLLRDEEIFWRQRSRALWLKEGDRNTKFFHRKATQRKQRNYIGRLVDDEGRIREGNEEVAGVIRGYFGELFRSSNPRDFGDVMAGIEGRVTGWMNDLLRLDS
ncbi:uncharacterized protein LOC141623208 [Silene latifolia]|uniref:uncharacterized protein LOC141623208 n=1 Tax=Silene latifolia TaxID=37657 RepID=UPI003D76B9CB